MTRLGDRLRRLERRRPAGPQRLYVHFFEDDYIEDGGERLTLEEFEARYPDCQFIQLTWGDDDNDRPLTLPFVADLWSGL